jgi:hypothetical protein
MMGTFVRYQKEYGIARQECPSSQKAQRTHPVRLAMAQLKPPLTDHPTVRLAAVHHPRKTSPVKPRGSIVRRKLRGLLEVPRYTGQLVARESELTLTTVYQPYSSLLCLRSSN